MNATIESDSVAKGLHDRLIELRLERGEKARKLYAARYTQWTSAKVYAALHPRDAKRKYLLPVILDDTGHGVNGTTWPEHYRPVLTVGALPRGEQVRRDYAMRANQWDDAKRAADRFAYRYDATDRETVIDAWGYRVDGKDSFAPATFRKERGAGLGCTHGAFSMVLDPGMDSESARKLIAKALSPKTWNAGKKPTRKRIPSISRKQAAERVAKAVANGDVVVVAA